MTAAEVLAAAAQAELEQLQRTIVTAAQHNMPVDMLGEEKRTNSYLSIWAAAAATAIRDAGFTRMVIHHGDPDALAAAQVEGFDEAMRQSFGGAEQRNWAIDQVLLALREGGEAELGALSDSTARPIAARIVDRLISEADLSPTFDVRYCRACRCTEDDCSGCIERTGQACHWIDWDLCSACEARVYVVCNRLLNPETNEHCEFDGYVDLDQRGQYRCPGCKTQRPAPEDEKTRIRKETIRDLIKAWPTITRDMVSRGHVRDWLIGQAEANGEAR